MNARIENLQTLKTEIVGTEECDATSCRGCNNEFNEGEQVDYVEYDCVFDEGTPEERISSGWTSYFHHGCHT